MALRVCALVEAQGGRCAYCGVRFTMDDIDVDEEAVWATFDHVVPRSRKGSNSIRNGLAACSPCNVRKGNHLPTKRERAMLARITPLALPIYARLKKERGSIPTRHEAKLAAKAFMSSLRQVAYTPVLRRPAAPEYREREQKALTAWPEPE